MKNPIRSLLAQPNALIMGILNVTPDSFSDGGHYHHLDHALRRAEQMIEDGADIIDIGGESTRPGADSVSLVQELDRVIPVIERVTKEFDTPVSIDTYKPKVMSEAVSAGAQMLNDVNGFRSTGAIHVAARANVPLCMMHMQGSPKEMQKSPEYKNVVEDVLEFFIRQIDVCVAEGIERRNIIIDPGIGFGKTLTHNLLLLNSISEIKHRSNCEVLVGVSRKSLIDMHLGRAVTERLPASLGLAVQSIINGAKIVRVHDVRATYDAIRMVEAVSNVRPVQE